MPTGRCLQHIVGLKRLFWPYCRKVIWVESWCDVAVFSAGTPILKIFFLFNFVLFFYMSGKLIFSAGTPILKIFLMSCTCFSCSYHSSQAHNSYSIYPTWTHSRILKNWKSRSLFPFPTLLKCQNIPTFSYIEWKAFPCAFTLCKCSFNICHVFKIMSNNSVFLNV